MGKMQITTRLLTSAMYMGIVFLMLGCEQKPSADKDTTTSSTESHEENNAPSHYEELKSLDWFVGDWADDDKDIDLTYTGTWDRNKNFLVQQFTSDLEDQDEIQGEQIIGWDPARKKIRSWVFDSDGGFGESSWSQEGEVWYSTMNFTLPDGRKASALHIYTKIDNDSYTFASTERNIDGEIFPDIGPFKMIRKK